MRKKKTRKRRRERGIEQKHKQKGGKAIIGDTEIILYIKRKSKRE